MPALAADSLDRQGAALAESVTGGLMQFSLQ